MYRTKRTEDWEPKDFEDRLKDLHSSWLNYRHRMSLIRSEFDYSKEKEELVELIKEF